MTRKIFRLCAAIFLTSVVITGCKKWDDYTAITDAAAGNDLYKQISADNDLSKFAELLAKSGYDTVIASSKTYTVFAPVNAALATLDPAIVNDAGRLKAFVGNHIANQVHTVSSAATTRRLQMLNGKYHNLQGSTLGEANIVTAGRYAKNGLIHTIDKQLPALPTAWQFVESNALMPAKQKDYFLSLFRTVFNEEGAEQIGVNPATGNPIYKAGTDSVSTNLFWRDVYDLRDERKEFTFFVMADTAWDSEVQKYQPYHIMPTSADSTQFFAAWAVARDLAIEGVYTQATLPDTIVSKYNTKIGIEKSAIVQSVKVSNGIVHIMKRMPVMPAHKFQPIVIEGENYDFMRLNRQNNVWFRNKYNPVANKQFRDVVVYDHNVAQFYLGYTLTSVPALKYKAYWVAVNDNINGNTGTFKQLLGIGEFNNTSRLPYTVVVPENYNEVLLGEFTLTDFKPKLNVFLTSENNSSNDFSNTMTLDYVRLVPVF